MKRFEVKCSHRCTRLTFFFLFNPAGASLDLASWELLFSAAKTIHARSEPIRRAEPEDAVQTRLARLAGTRVEVEEGQGCLEQCAVGWSLQKGREGEGRCVYECVCV